MHGPEMLWLINESWIGMKYNINNLSLVLVVPETREMCSLLYLEHGNKYRSNHLF